MRADEEVAAHDQVAFRVQGMWNAAARHHGYYCGRSSPFPDQIEMLVVVVGIAVTTLPA
jgi:hypothetical protein